MNIQELHPKEKAVSAISLLKGNINSITALQILSNQHLKEHLTKVPALLICITGNATYEDEKGKKTTLRPGDYVNIESMVKHWIMGIEDSNLLLIKSMSEPLPS
jgi:quercetin dioxygenase-like cupin family protein